MNDEDSRPVPHDPNSVDITDADEVRFWTKQLGCTVEQLKAAVQKVGVMVEDIVAELKLRFA